MNIEFRTFLRTGKLGFIASHSSEDDVISRLGKLKHSCAKASGVNLYLFGDIEVAFFENQIIYIQFDLEKGRCPKGCEELELYESGYVGGSSLEEILVHLNKDGLSYKIEDDQNNPGTKIIITDSEVHLSVECDSDNEHNGLNNIIKSYF